MNTGTESDRRGCVAAIDACATSTRSSAQHEVLAMWPRGSQEERNAATVAGREDVVDAS